MCQGAQTRRIGRLVKQHIQAASPKKAKWAGGEYVGLLLGKRRWRKTLKKKKAANPYGCGFFVNYPAWIRTRTKRAKISCATVTLRGNFRYRRNLLFANGFWRRPTWQTKPVIREQESLVLPLHSGTKNADLSATHCFSSLCYDAASTGSGDVRPILVPFGFDGILIGYWKSAFSPFVATRKSPPGVQPAILRLYDFSVKNSLSYLVIRWVPTLELPRSRPRRRRHLFTSSIVRGFRGLVLVSRYR